MTIEFDIAKNKVEEKYKVYKIISFTLSYLICPILFGVGLYLEHDNFPKSGVNTIVEGLQYIPLTMISLGSALIIIMAYVIFVMWKIMEVLND